MCLFDNEVVKSRSRWNYYVRYKIQPEFQSDPGTGDCSDTGKYISKG